MADKKAFVIADLGGGDGGKGGVVHALCTQMQAHTVVKIGGAQGSHGVRTSRGESFAFSQFGCGTFEGIPTFLSRNIIIDPYVIVDEGSRLQYQWGISNAFDLITVDGKALCVTPFHRFTSQLRELHRKEHPKGTIGTGVGEAARDAELFPNLVIRAEDIGRADLCSRLEAVREQKLRDLGDITINLDSFWADDRALAGELMELLHDPDMARRAAEQFRTMAAQVRTVDESYLRDNILRRDGVVVFETSHGILTDRFHGFHPHTSRLRTIPARMSLPLLSESGYDGKIILLGVTRAYQIRHGAGPMVTACPDMVEKLLPGSSKEENRWQGKVRVGPLDCVALRYAIDVCGGPQVFSGLAITWFDQIQTFGQWDICDRYSGADDPDFFSPVGEINVRRGSDAEQLAYQKKLGELLVRCQPVLTTYQAPSGMSKKKLIRLCADVLKEQSGIPVRMISFGPTEQDKICL